MKRAHADNQPGGEVSRTGGMSREVGQPRKVAFAA